MRDELLDYYQDELTFLRQMGAEFAKKYPGAAGRLELEPGKCRDPHVERMMEAFAFLTARVHLKLNDEFPSITESLLNVLYPHYLRPVPSMASVEFRLDPQQGQLTTGLKIDRGTVLFTRPVEGYQCRFSTCYDVTLWPMEITEAQWTTPDRLKPAIRTNAVAALRLEIGSSGDLPLGALDVRNLQFCLNGEARIIYGLYELLCCNCSQVLVRNPAKRGAQAVPLPPQALRPMGFENAEAILPLTRRSFSGYRLLQEYFAFPDKFFFFDLSGLGSAWNAEFGSKVEILFLIDRFELPERQQHLETGISRNTIRLGCSPVVNLFPHTCEPILADHLRAEYPIVPDILRRGAFEIFSVDKVSTSDSAGNEIQYEPFYSYHHGTAGDRKRAFWHAIRKPSMKQDDSGTDMFLSLMDMTGREMRPDRDTLTVRCTCTNRDLPSRLPIGSFRPRHDRETDFELEIPSIQSVVALNKPTPTLRPDMGNRLLWRLISHLSLNYLSLVSEGKEALQEILALYNFASDPAVERQIAAVSELSSAPQFGPVASDDGVSFVRGMRVEMTFDEEQFTGGGVYLFASVLERFLGLYASLNSFSQLVARTEERREPVREWPPRAGERILL